MTKILLNICFGGFSLPEDFLEKLYKNESTKKYIHVDNDNYYLDHSEFSLSFRTDPNVIKLFEEEYPKGFQTFASAVVVEEIDEEKYPNWYFKEYDGMESIIKEIKNRGFSYA